MSIRQSFSQTCRYIVAFVLSVVLLALGCAPDEPPVGRDEPLSDTAVALADCEPWVTWDTVGDPFVRSWCTECHSASLTGPDRAGAPAGVDLDTLEGVRDHAPRVEARVESASMPPNASPDADQVARFLGWLQCGLPE